MSNEKKPLKKDAELLSPEIPKPYFLIEGIAVRKELLKVHS